LRARPGDAARHIKAACTALAVAASLALGTAAAGERDVWGYGVRGCDAYLEALANADTGDAAELQRYEDWLTGFVSALNLALGEDVLRGSGLTAALRGTREYCRANGGQDFFNAAMDHVRGLSSLR
jgi:hypothetical protein